MNMMPSRPYPPVRALSRGLAILAELNAGGPTPVRELAQRTGLNRTTTYRLLETLRTEGFVSFNETSGLFSATPQVRRLSDGLTIRDESSQAALPAMFELLREVNWPSDLAVFEAGSVVIRESTHPFSPFSVHRAVVGHRRSLLRSALGRAILSAATPDLRRDMLEMAAGLGGGEATLARNEVLVKRLLAQVERQGYASSTGETEQNINAIALPIRAGEQVFGSLNLIFFARSMTPETAAERYLPKLRAATADIERRLSWPTALRSA